MPSPAGRKAQKRVRAVRFSETGKRNAGGTAVELGGYSSSALITMRTNSARDEAPVFSITFARWISTVRSLMSRRLATTLLAAPLLTAACAAAPA